MAGLMVVVRVFTFLSRRDSVSRKGNCRDNAVAESVFTYLYEQKIAKAG